MDLHVPLLAAAALLGLTHALEADHVAAVAGLAAGHGPRHAAIAAACWGAGHGGLLLAVGAPLAMARGALPEPVAWGAELVVAALLVAMGAALVLRPTHHPPPSAHAARSVGMGAAHGLAGSGAAAVLAAAATAPAAAVAFLAAFGAASAGAMGALGLAVGGASLVGRVRAVARPLAGVACVAAAVGLLV